VSRNIGSTYKKKIVHEKGEGGDEGKDFSVRRGESSLFKSSRLQREKCRGGLRDKRVNGDTIAKHQRHPTPGFPPE